MAYGYNPMDAVPASLFNTLEFVGNYNRISILSEDIGNL